ncbi:T9SS type A sorting domain-containing protein [Flavivirga jejuensis]|uniref:T9SS type A sorting domain-containing protein n=1 Tax=Flavivirga jejuensis TaxID=870487 RepID=A0ABT8WV92_9FLAO|nr:T9SS type A sorting domain-containing protein [Flavivirga jejuensis]MDO5977070.1 T9SS type A sorting domain-containing protein [Flavivirga jejuensis]
MKKNTILFLVLALIFTGLTHAQITFGWETAEDLGGDSISETIGDITVTLTNNNTGAGIALWPEFNGSSGTYVAGTSDSFTFTFNQSVNVLSILPLGSEFTPSATYLFARLDGNGVSPVTVLITDGVASGSAPIDLNWTNVSSFIVSASSSIFMGFDLLTVDSSSLSTAKYKLQKVRVYPNPVEDKLTIKNVSDFKSIDVYNNLGQRVLQSKQESIDVGHFSKGFYFLQIHMDSGVKTRTIVKK